MSFPEPPESGEDGVVRRQADVVDDKQEVQFDFTALYYFTVLACACLPLMMSCIDTVNLYIFFLNLTVPAERTVII